MKSELLRTIMYLSKSMFYIFLLQTVSLQLLFAGNSLGQALKEVEIEIHLKNVSLVEVFKEIESKTEFNFVYDRSISLTKKKFTLESEKSSLEEILTEIAKEGNLQFQRINGSIYVKKASKKEDQAKPVIEIDRTIQGKVLDSETGEPLIGATVLVKGTGIGTITNVDGGFTLDIPEDAKSLTVSFIGYRALEISIGSLSSFDIELSSDVSALNEVVVFGYGSGTKDKFNGAVSKVDNELLNTYSSANFEQGISGNIAGVLVSGNGKNPGDNSVIQIRGISTLTAGTSPLIVVDGNPLTEGSSYSSINTQDIESVSILKDAASAAIYGSRASNGVILITTKKSKEGKLRVTYDGYIGVQQRIDNFELADAYSTAIFDLDARNFGYLSGGTGRSISDDNATRDTNGGGKRSRLQPFLSDYVSGVPGLTNTNWTDEVFRNAKQESHHINLSGGTSNVDYSVSFGLLSQENIIISSDYRRYTTNFRINTNVSERVRFGISSNISLVNANPTGESGWSNYSLNNNSQVDPAFSVILMHPYYPVRNSDGSFAISNQLDDNNDNWDGPISENTIAQTELTDYEENQFRVFGNTYLEIEPIDNLKFKTSFGGDYTTGREQFFAPSTIGNYRTPIENNLAQAFENNTRRQNFLTENTLNYLKTIDSHTFDILLGYSFQQERSDWTRLEGNNFADDNLRNVSGATNPTASSISGEWALESFFSRLQYDFDGKYSLSGSLRRDGSSRFGTNTKYGSFASLSAGWTISSESFFPTSDAFSFAKIRTSWGLRGNNQIGDFASIALISEDNYTTNGSIEAGSFTNTSPNPDLSWETNTALNFGIDLGFMDNKLLFTAEYYTSKTTDLLLDVPVPQQSGFSQSLQNIGELENNGFELELKGRGYRVGDLRLGFNANFTTNQNKVLALGTDQEQIIMNNGGMDFLTRVGESISLFYAYDIIGVYRSQSEIDNDDIIPLPGTEVGDYIVRDANNDGEINSDDRVTLGDYNPEFTYGFGITAQYKGFDLSAQFFGIEGRKVSDRMVYFAESGEGFFVPSQYYVDNYFNERNPDGFFRRPDFSSFSSAGRLTRASSLSVYDADYFRLRSLQIGYTIPSRITDKIGIGSARVYFTGNNLFNITDYRGYNADGLDTRSNERQTLTRGWIQSTSPLTRFMALGVNVKF